MSNFTLYDAESIEESKLKSFIHNIPEITKAEADAMDDSTFASLFKESSLYGLFHLERSTANDTSRVYSSGSDTSDEYSHEESGALIDERA